MPRIDSKICHDLLILCKACFMRYQINLDVKKKVSKKRQIYEYPTKRRTHFLSFLFYPAKLSGGNAKEAQENHFL